MSGVLPFSEALERFKKLNVGDTGPAPVVELWASSGGCVRSKKFAKVEVPVPGLTVREHGDYLSEIAALQDKLKAAEEKIVELEKKVLEVPVPEVPVSGEAAAVIAPEGGQARVPASLPGAPEAPLPPSGKSRSRG